MPSWFSCFSINNKRNGNTTISSSAGGTGRNHRESNNFNNHYTDEYSIGQVDQRRRDFLDDGRRIRINQSHNQQEYFQHSMTNRWDYDSQDSEDSEEMHHGYALPPVVNHQPITFVNEPIVTTRPPLRRMAVNQTLVYDAKSINWNKYDTSSKKHVQEVPQCSPSSSVSCSIKKQSSNNTLFSLGIKSVSSNNSAKVSSTLV